MFQNWRRLIGFKSINYSTRVAKNNYDYTVDFVKINDYNIYLSTLLTPESALRSAFAVRAFNIELLSLIRSSTDSKSQMSLMKLQFWKVGDFYIINIKFISSYF